MPAFRCSQIVYFFRFLPVKPEIYADTRAKPTHSKKPMNKNRSTDIVPLLQYKQSRPQPNHELTAAERASEWHFIGLKTLQTF